MTVGWGFPSGFGPGSLEPKAKDKGTPYKLVMAIVKLSGLPLYTAGVEVGMGVGKGVSLGASWTTDLVALGVTLGLLLRITLWMLLVVALDLMVGAVPGVILATEIFFCSGVLTGASVADELGGVTEVWMIRGVLLGGKLGEDDWDDAAGAASLGDGDADASGWFSDPRWRVTVTKTGSTVEVTYMLWRAGSWTVTITVLWASTVWRGVKRTIRNAARVKVCFILPIFAFVGK